MKIKTIILVLFFVIGVSSFLVPNIVRASETCFFNGGIGQFSGITEVNWFGTTAPAWYFSIDVAGIIIPGSCRIANNNPDCDGLGFTAAVAACDPKQGVGACNCLKAVAKSYEIKSHDNIKSQIDAKIKSAGVDSDRSSDIATSCGGDLACVASALAGISADPSFAQSTSISISGPLTLGDAQSLINSNNTSTGISNSATNAGSAASLLGKQQGPSVKVIFSSDAGIKNGLKVKATAIPSGYSNASDPKGLYFTWYLKRDGCGKDDSYKASCDFDGNGKVDENDWKIDAAMMTIRANSFDKSGADYSKTPTGFSDDMAGVEANPKVENSGTDKSGWIKTADNDIDNGTSDKVPNCYVQDPKIGLFYELRNTKPTINACFDGYHQACVSNVASNTIGCDTLNPSCKSTTCQNTDSSAANYVDPLIGITVNSKPPFNVCTTQSINKANNAFSCSTNDNIIQDYKTIVSCTDNSGNKTGEAVCLKDDGSNTNIIDSGNALVGTIFGLNKASNNNTEFCGKIFNPNSLNWTILTNPVTTPPAWLSTINNNYTSFSSSNQQCAGLVDKLVNGTKNSSGTVDITGNTKSKATCSFNKDVNLCKHLFPVYKSGLNLKNNNGDDAKIGDGKFSFNEKKFWGADPTNDSTNGTEKDEAAIMGLGVDNLSWTYNQGDQIGVAVEGQSMLPTDHNDSAYRIMWAFSNGTCEALEKLSKSSSTSTEGDFSEGEKSFYIDEKNGKGIFATNLDLNDCLEENLLDPRSDNSAMSDFALNLNISPDGDLINDPSGVSGTPVTATSLPTNTKGVSSLMYNWHIEESLDGAAAPGDNTQWKDITSDLESVITHTAFSGLGKNEFGFSLNIPASVIPTSDNVFYLRIKANATENIGSGSQKAVDSKIVKVYQQKAKLFIYPVLADSSGMLSLDRGISQNSKELCVNEATNCGVTKNEIMGAVVETSDTKSSLSGFSWKINGNVIQCDKNISSACTNAAGNILFFPILGNEGESVNLQAVGVSTNSEGVTDNIAINKSFVIVKPSVQIISANSKTAWAKILGFYKDLDGNRYPDYGKGTTFESSPGYKVQLQANFYPAWKEAQADYTWTINGEKQDLFSNTKTIAFNTEGSIKDTYNIELAAIYKPGTANQVNNLRKALLKNWNVSMTDVEETNESAAIQINLVNDQATNQDGTSLPWSANLLSHLPEQALFLFRIIISAFILLFSTGIVFAIIPESSFEKKRV